MFRFFIKNLLVLACLVGILVILVLWIIRGWTGYWLGIVQLGGIAFLVFMLVHDLRSRDKYDPVRKFFEKAYDRIN